MKHGTKHKVPNDLQKVILGNERLLAIWDSLTPLSRNEWICWVTIVKKEETRKDHIKRLQEEILDGEKRPCCWPGCPHHRPNAKKWFVPRKK